MHILFQSLNGDTAIAIISREEAEFLANYKELTATISQLKERILRMEDHNAQNTERERLPR